MLRRFLTYYYCAMLVLVNIILLVSSATSFASVLTCRFLNLGVFDNKGEEMGVLYCDKYRVEDAIDDLFIMSDEQDLARLFSAGNGKKAVKAQITKHLCEGVHIDKFWNCDHRPPSPVMGTLSDVNSAPRSTMPGRFPIRVGYSIDVLIGVICHYFRCSSYSIDKMLFDFNRIMNRYDAKYSLVSCQESKFSKHCPYTNEFAKKYYHNEYSQNGEDGIINEILKRLNIVDGWVCEFGAWDGKYLSNTFSLIKKGFNGVFIEGDDNKYLDLLNTSAEYPNIVPIHAHVHFMSRHVRSLDNILKKTAIPKNFEVLSIDIDSYDYYVWRHLSHYVPKIVIIEMNPHVGTDNDHVHDYHEAFDDSILNQEERMSVELGGTGFRPMLRMGTSKGYKFVLHTGCNMIFVRQDLFDTLKLHYVDELENFDLTAL